MPWERVQIRREEDGLSPKELEAMSQKIHDASGQLVHDNQELLQKEQRLRLLLLGANHHSPGPKRDLSHEVNKAEWRINEQTLKDDIRGLYEKLTGLDKKSLSEQRRYSLIDAVSAPKLPQ